MSDFRLKAFYSVAKNLSFTKASQELFVSQPAITKHIRELESLYQVRLFNRMGSKISLTEAGTVLLEHCERILAEYRRLEYDMHLLNKEYVGELRLGASTTIAQYVLPPVLARFTEKYPKITVSATDCPIGQSGEISLEEFKQVPLVLRERGSGTLDAIELALAEQHLKLSSLNVRMYLGSTESIKSFLRYSHSMGIVSITALAKELKEGSFRIVDIAGLQFKRHFCFVSAQGQEAETVVHFMRFLQQQL